MADGETLTITRVGSVRLCVIAEGKERTLKLTDVYLAPHLGHNIVSYGNHELDGFGLTYNSATPALVKRSKGEVDFDLKMKKCSLRPGSGTLHGRGTPADVFMTNPI